MHGPLEKAGFSLVEAMVAVSVLLIGGMGITRLASSSMKSVISGSNITSRKGFETLVQLQLSDCDAVAFTLASANNIQLKNALQSCATSQTGALELRNRANTMVVPLAGRTFDKSFSFCGKSICEFTAKMYWTCSLNNYNFKLKTTYLPSLGILGLDAAGGVIERTFAIDSALWRKAAQNSNGQLCPAGEVVVGVRADGANVCRPVSALLAGISCPPQEFLQGFSGTGIPRCAPMPTPAPTMQPTMIPTVVPTATPSPVATRQPPLCQIAFVDGNGQRKGQNFGVVPDVQSCESNCNNYIAANSNPPPLCYLCSFDSKKLFSNPPNPCYW